MLCPSQGITSRKDLNLICFLKIEWNALITEKKFLCLGQEVIHFMHIFSELLCALPFL